MTLIGYWPLNEESGDTAYDYSGNENHMSMNGSPTQGVNGISGAKAYQFNGDNDYLEVSDWDFPATTGRTVCAWVYASNGALDSTVASGDGKIYGIVRTNDEASLRIEENGSFHTRAHNSSGDTSDVYNGDTILLEEEWTHICVTFWSPGSDENIELRLFANGRKIMDETTTLTDSQGLVGGGGGTLMRIASDEDSTEREFPGRISEARIYGRALSPTEVQYLYNVSRRGRFTSRKKQP